MIGTAVRSPFTAQSLSSIPSPCFSFLLHTLFTFTERSGNVSHQTETNPSNAMDVPIATSHKNLGVPLPLTYLL